MKQIVRRPVLVTMLLLLAAGIIALRFAPEFTAPVAASDAGQQDKAVAASSVEEDALADAESELPTAAPTNYSPQPSAPMEMLPPEQARSASFITVINWRAHTGPKSYAHYHAVMLREADPRDLRQLAEAGDADAAYQLARFYEQCLKSPATADALERQLDAYDTAFARMAQRRGEQFLPVVDETLSNMMSLYDRCQQAAASDLFLEFLHWFERAGDAGHLMARISYEQSAGPIFLMDRNALRFPERLLGYRARVREYAESLYQSGHPRGFIEMARLLDDGIHYHREPVRALGFALAGEDAGNYGLELQAHEAMQLRQLTDRLEAELGSRELGEARKLANKLCDQYC